MAEGEAIQQEPQGLVEGEVTRRNRNKQKILENNINEVAATLILNTSCLAIGNIVLRQHAILKTLWCVAFVLCCIFSIRQLYNLSTTYFSYPATTTINLQYGSIVFPSITICNHNPLRRSQVPLHATPELDAFLDDLAGRFYNQTDNGTEIETSRKDWRIFHNLVSQNSRKARLAMGTQLDDLVLQCFFDGKLCDMANQFEVFLDKTFGNCFTFNPSKRYNTSGSPGPIRSGRSKGLLLTMYIEQKEYLRNFISSAGARVHVHESGSFESPDSLGFSVPPGYEIFNGIAMSRIQRLGLPYGNCTYGQAFRNQYERVYTYKTCIEVCQHRTITEKCGCQDIASPSFLLSQKYRYCTTNVDVHCMLNIMYEREEGQLRCDCPLACKEYEYKMKTSFSEWPADTYEKRLFGDLFDLKPKILNLKNISKSEARRNLINLIVYMEENYYNEITQKPVYPWDNYISDIGGTLSLFLGFSVLTGFEMIEAFSLLLAYICGKICYGHSAEKKESEALLGRETQTERKYT